MKVANTSGSPNYIRIINWFWDNVPFIDGYKSSHCTLFFAIYDSINRSKWVPTNIRYQMLIKKCGFSKQVYLDGRNWLIENGLVHMEEGRNGYQTAKFYIGIAVQNLTAINDIAVQNQTGKEEVKATVPVQNPTAAEQIPVLNVTTERSEMLPLSGPKTDPLIHKQVNSKHKYSKQERADESAPLKSFKKITEEDFYNEIAEYVDKYPKDLLRNFYEYWSEKSPAGKMKFQLKETWELSKRLSTWASREKNQNNGTAHRQNLGNGQSSNGASIKRGTSEARTEAAKHWSIG